MTDRKKNTSWMSGFAGGMTVNRRRVRTEDGRELEMREMLNAALAALLAFEESGGHIASMTGEDGVCHILLHVAVPPETEEGFVKAFGALKLAAEDPDGDFIDEEWAVYGDEDYDGDGRGGVIDAGDEPHA